MNDLRWVLNGYRQQILLTHTLRNKYSAFTAILPYNPMRSPAKILLHHKVVLLFQVELWPILFNKEKELLFKNPKKIRFSPTPLINGKKDLEEILLLLLMHTHQQRCVREYLHT